MPGAGHAGAEFIARPRPLQRLGTDMRSYPGSPPHRDTPPAGCSSSIGYSAHPPATSDAAVRQLRHRRSAVTCDDLDQQPSSRRRLLLRNPSILAKRINKYLQFPEFIEIYRRDKKAPFSARMVALYSADSCPWPSSCPLRLNLSWATTVQAPRHKGSGLIKMSWRCSNG